VFSANETERAAVSHMLCGSELAVFIGLQVKAGVCSAAKLLE